MIKIMSFNIRYGTAEDGRNHWDNRKQLVIDRIRSFDADLIGLQECRNDHQAQFIREQLGDYQFMGISREFHDPEMSPLLFKRSAFEEVASGHFWLSSAPHVPGSRDWGSAFPRTVSWVSLRTKTNPAHQLIFFNTHFDYKSEQARNSSAKLLRARINAFGYAMPVVLTGDFNTNRDTSPYHIMLENSPLSPQLYDTYRDRHSLGTTSEGTYHEYEQLSDPTSIDWILVSQHFATQEAIIDKYHQDDLYPSDHYPIMTVVDFRA